MVEEQEGKAVAKGGGCATRKGRAEGEAADDEADAGEVPTAEDGSKGMAGATNC